jgi:glycosyltransferase involved in cell wall biosynthesis
MKALLINSLSKGGAERIVLNIADGLLTLNKDIVVISLIKKDEYLIQKNTKIFYLNKSKNYPRGFKLIKIISFLSLILKLKKTIKQHKITIVQSHLYSASIINVFSKLAGSRHKVQIVNHMYLSYEFKRRFSGFLKTVILRNIYSKADLIVSISNKMMSDINETLLKNKNVNHIVIPNPHNIDEIIKSAKEHLTTFNFKNDCIYIITVGRLVQRKRINNLIHAFPELKLQNKNLKIIILGDGPEADSIKKDIDKFNLQNDVYLMGFVENPYTFLDKADIFILTSESEGLPNVLIEAMLCKIPVISTDCQTGPRELIAPDSNLNYQIKEGIEIGCNGMLIPVNNIESIVESILYLLKNNDLKSELVENAFHYASQFSFNNIIKKYSEILED